MKATLYKIKQVWWKWRRGYEVSYVYNIIREWHDSIQEMKSFGRVKNMQNCITDRVVSGTVFFLFCISEFSSSVNDYDVTMTQWLITWPRYGDAIASHSCLLASEGRIATSNSTFRKVITVFLVDSAIAWADARLTLQMERIKVSLVHTFNWTDSDWPMIKFKFKFKFFIVSTTSSPRRMGLLWQSKLNNIT